MKGLLDRRQWHCLRRFAVSRPRWRWQKRHRCSWKSYTQSEDLLEQKLTADFLFLASSAKDFNDRRQYRNQYDSKNDVGKVILHNGKSAKEEAQHEETEDTDSGF